MATVKFTAKVDTTNAAAALGLTVRLGTEVVFETAHVTQPIDIEYSINDDEAQHRLQFELHGKLPEHTVVNDSGEIVTDAMLMIRNITIEEVDISRLVEKQAVYSHDFNGTGNPVNDNFFGDIGCNGTVTFEFSTPFYLWLLENM